MAVCLASAAPAAAQMRITVQGRVVESGSGSPVASATVELEGRPVATTDPAGAFRFDSVAPGAYTVRVTALGYVPADAFAVLRRDTTLLVTLAVAPLPLDPLAVQARRISIRGRVQDSVSREDLFRAEVVTSIDRRTHTNLAGRFRLRDMPAGFPVTIGIRAFGYMPVDIPVIADADTTLTFDMPADPVVQRMLAAQVTRLEERARGYRTAIMPAMNRDELMRRGNSTVLDVLRSRYGIHMRRISCILIDERQTYNGLEELALYFPEEIERVEVLERGAMLRIYTRDFMRKMIGGNVRLQRPVYVSYGNPPVCR